MNGAITINQRLVFHTDCRHWRGDKPCRENRLCGGCRAYAPWGHKILIIKLGARGDVLRTTPLLDGLHKRYPAAHITWLTNPESVELLQDLTGLNRLLALGLESHLEILARRFDLLICLDKEPRATGLAHLARARRKCGWGLAQNGTGTPCALNARAGYSLALGVWDDLKFRQNQKTYLEIIFEVAGLRYAGQKYAFTLNEADRRRSREFFEKNRIKAGRQLIIGFFTGCGPAFQRKRWTEEGFAKLARLAAKELKAKVLLMAGPEEQAINARIRRLSRMPLLDTGGKHSLRELAGFLEACSAVVTGDTVALHLALALGKPTLALFGPTAAQEIDMFGLGEKIVSPLPCVPCYRRTCEAEPDCMQGISVETVWPALLRLGKGTA